MIHSRNKILNTATTVVVAACTQHRHHSYYRRRTTLSGSSTLLCFVSAPANYSALLSPQSDSVPPHSPLRFEKMKHEAEAEAKVLPLELVEKILLWLPVKSLIRFRLLYLSSEVPEARCVDLEAPIRGDYALQLPRCCRHFSLSILGSSRGFILLRIHVYGAPLLLWNPVTGSYRSVPYPVVDPDASCWTGSDNLWGGLGYDESSDDYLVVVGWGNGHEWRPQWEYFSVRTNSWKKIECGHLPPHLVTIESALFCNGVLYWLAVKDMEVKFVIVAFDLAGKHLSLVSFPTSGGRLLNLFAGCLGLYYLNFTEDHQKFEIWVMKELSWTKLNVVLPYAHGIHPLCLTKGELVGIKNNELVKVSDKGVSVESLRISCRDNDLKMVMFTQSLLSLPDEFGCTGEEQGK
nr:F-box/kelch-repeat protein At3g23880 isoform X2 [Arachis hypogaea]